MITIKEISEKDSNCESKKGYILIRIMDDDDHTLDHDECLPEGSDIKAFEDALNKNKGYE